MTGTLLAAVTEGQQPQLGSLDLWIIGVYLILLLVMGGMLGKLIKNSEDMFAAGGKSPWWLSGISAYMTMFSSGTFVVWGGIAYKGGMAAVSICLTLGISALLVGMFWASKWKATGATSAAQYIQLRYGQVAVQVYTWLGIVVRLIGSGVALYSIAIMICAVVPIAPPEEGSNWAWMISLLRDEVAGTLDYKVAIIAIGLVVVVISGNLWAVLVTDTLQFIVLTASVIIVVPLLLGHEAVGGLGGFIEAAKNTPAVYDHGGELLVAEGKNLLSPTSGKFTWLFLAGWIIIHMFKIGGEWAFVQRFLCVPSKKDAAKVGFIFGILYLISPMIWMLPPMIYRIMQPIPEGMPPDQVKLLAEQAYIFACEAVLPAGLIGLMIAAMFSATVSMVDSEINVYAGAVTRDIYGRLFHKLDDEKHLVFVGRILTVFMGAGVMTVAIAVPNMGGAQSIILSITGLFVGPMVLPTIWGLFSKKVGLDAVFVTAVIGAGISALYKYVLLGNDWISLHSREAEVIVGIIPPLLTLMALEFIPRGDHRSWPKVLKLRDDHHQAETAISSDVPRLIVGWSLLALAFVFLLIITLQDQHRMLIGGATAVLIVMAGLTFLPSLMKSADESASSE